MTAKRRTTGCSLNAARRVHETSAHVPVQLSTNIHSKFQTSCSSSSEHFRVAARDPFKVFMVEGGLEGRVAGKLRYGKRHTLPYGKLRPCQRGRAKASLKEVLLSRGCVDIFYREYVNMVKI